MKFYFPLLTIALFLFPQFTTAQEWVKYKSKEGKFQIEFPGEPKEDIQKKEDSKTIQLQVESNDVIYMGSAVIHQTKLDVAGVTPEMLAESSLDAFAGVIGGNITKKEDFKMNGVNGKACTISNPDQGFECHYKCIIIGQIQYQFIVMSAPSNSNKENRDKFFDSIKIK